MAKMTTEQSEKFLALPNLAHFITLRADGSPHAAPVWYEFADGRFHVFTPATSVKLRNLGRDSRMTLSIASPDQPYSYVVASGRAEIMSGDIIGRAVSIASRYEGLAGGVQYIETLQTRFSVSVVAMAPIRMVGWVTD